MKTHTAIALIVLFAALWCRPAHADRRNFAWLYEPKTMVANELEVEYYMTGVVRYDRLADEHRYDWAHQVELEYGLTDRWDVSMYQMFGTSEMFGTSGWTGYKLRTRYRPYDPGQLPVDFLVYGEVIGLSSGDYALEERVIVGKTIGPVVISTDTMFEQGPLLGDRGYKWIESLGVAYEFHPWISLGLETQARMLWAPKFVYGDASPSLEYEGTKVYAGPTISLAGSKVWWDLNLSMRAIGEHDDPRFLFRVLWGVFL